MGKRRNNSSNYFDNLAGGIMQGLLAQQALQQRQDTLDMQRETNKAHAEYYRAAAEEKRRDAADAALFAGYSSGQATVGAGGPGTVASSSRAPDPTTGLDPAMREVDAAMPPAEVSQATPSGARSVASAPKAGGIMGGLDSRFRERLLAAAAEQGVDLKATDGYRDLPGQQDVRARKGSLAANPGYSVHGARLAADIDPTQADALEASGALDRAGLHRPYAQRAKNPEPWHVEPLGVDTAAARAQMQAAMAAGQDPTKLDYANFYTPQGGQYATTRTAGAAPQAAPQQAAAGLDTSNMLADAGTSMSDAGTGYNMRGNKAIAADVNGVAPAQAPQRGSRAIASDFGSTQTPQAAPQAAGLNPAAAQAVVPQSRAGLMGMIEQELQQLQAKRQQLDAIQPQGKAGVIRKAAELKQLENEERWIYGKAVEAQRQKEQADKDAATRASADGRDALALRNEQARIAHDKATLDQHKVTNDRTQKNDDRAAADKWASSIKEVAEADGRFQTRDNANSQEQGEHGINPRKANTLRQAMVAHYGEMVPDGKGGITPAFKDGNKDVADITTKMGTLSEKYNQALTDLQKKFPNEDPAKLESLIDHNTIFKMIDRDVDLANKAAAAQQKNTGAAAEQASPSAPAHKAFTPPPPPPQGAPAPASGPAYEGSNPGGDAIISGPGLGLNPQATPEQPAGQGLNIGERIRLALAPGVGAAAQQGAQAAAAAQANMNPEEKINYTLGTNVGERARMALEGRAQAAAAAGSGLQNPDTGPYPSINFNPQGGQDPAAAGDAMPSGMVNDLPNNSLTSRIGRGISEAVSQNYPGSTVEAPAQAGPAQRQSPVFLGPQIDEALAAKAKEFNNQSLRSIMEQYILASPEDKAALETMYPQLNSDANLGQY